MNVRIKNKSKMEDTFDLRKYLSEGQLFENDQPSKEEEEKIVKKFEALMKKGLATAANLKNEPVSKKDGEIKELLGVTIATLIIGAPGIIKVLGFLSQAVGWLFGANKGDGNWLSRKLKKAADWLHHKYIDGIKWGLLQAYPSRYNDDEKLAEKDAKKAYAAMLVAAMVATGISAVHAVNQVIQTLEIAHIGVDAADIAAIAVELSKEVGAAV